MADPKLRLMALTVLGGALHGRRHNPDEVVTEILVGSDPDCHLVVDLPGVSPIHARLWADLDQAVVYDTRAPRGLYVNTDRVEGQAPIGEGDVLWLGPPQEAESVCVKLHFGPWVEQLPPAGPVLSDEPTAPEPAETAFAEAAPSPPLPVAPPSSETVPQEEDPFFVGEEPESPPTQPRPEATAGTPVVGEAAPTAAPPRKPPAAASLPNPQDLVAETVADDWVIADETPPAAGPPPGDADAFFVAEEPLPQPAAEAPIVEANSLPAEPVAPVSVPALDLPSLESPPPGAPAPVPAPPSPPIPPPSPAPPPRETLAAAPSPPASVRPAAPGPRSTAAARRERAPAPPRASPAPAPRPPAVRRPSPAGRPARRPARGAPGWLRPVGRGAIAVVVLGALGFGALRLFGGGVRLDAVEPVRLRVGQRAILTGAGFAPGAEGNTVLFDGRRAKVLQASPTRLEIEVPEAVAESGAEKRVGVLVRKGGRASSALDVTVFQGPRLHGISPEAAMPGEEVVLAGAGWGPGSAVRFGAATAQVNEVQPTRIRAVVPEGAGAPGTPAPVVVTVGGVDSNPAPFIVGRLPLVTGTTPAKAAPGDVVEVSGRGFQDDPLRNDVRIGGVPALTLESRGDALRVVVPRLGPGEVSRVLEVRVPGSEAVGQATLEVEPRPDPVPFRFVAEPFTAGAGRPHAVLATGLGPAFVLAAAGGRTGAARAVEAAGRLNAAGEALRTTVGLNLEARGFDGTPVLALPGRSDVLIEVTPEDAAAYNEDWSGLKGRGGPVTPARLARWWEGVGRDLVLLTVRGERPRYAAELAPEGRVLGQLFDLAQRAGRAGIPLQVVDEARPPLRDGLRLLALRVPASVTPPVAAAPLAPPPAAPPAPARLALQGTWTGSQMEEGQRQYLTVVFEHGEGSIAYEGGLTFTVPLQSLDQPRRDQARFSVQIRGGVRHYAGTWDGEKLAGSISTDAAGRNVVATFELRQK
jgi:hypothetical protein